MHSRNSQTIPYNTTIEDLEIRVERLEEAMFQAQAEIIENQAAINSLQFSLQETIETVSWDTTHKFAHSHLQALDSLVNLWPLTLPSYLYPHSKKQWRLLSENHPPYNF